MFLNGKQRNTTERSGLEARFWAVADQTQTERVLCLISRNIITKKWNTKFFWLAVKRSTRQCGSPVGVTQLLQSFTKRALLSQLNEFMFEQLKALWNIVSGWIALYRTLKYQLNLTFRHWRPIPVWRGHCGNKSDHLWSHAVFAGLCRHRTHCAKWCAWVRA